MKLMERLKRGLAALGIGAAAACSTAAPAVPASTSAPRPALWQVSDDDTTIYLFGTIHLLPKNSRWHTPTLDRAISQSDGLYVETIIDEANPRELVAELARTGFSQNLPPIAERVDPSKRELLHAAIKKSGVPRTTYDQMETWAAAFTLLGQQFKSLGLEGGEGVESVLRKSFAAAGKEIGQLETNREQLGFFDTLPESAQRELLAGALETPADMSRQFDAMLRAWLSGDVEAIGKSFNDNLDASPELMNALITRRNANWSKWIEQRMAAPGTILVAVGAGHLAGRDSVQKMLQKRGVRIRRLQ